MATSDEQTPVENALANSVLVGNLSRVSTTLKRFITASFLYRWLTKEPEPDVIVIDLRDTYTVGPFITLLDWIIDGLSQAAQGSAIAQTGQRLGEAFIETPIRVSGGFVFLLGLIALLFAVLTPSVTQALIAIAIALIGLVATRNTTSLAEIKQTKTYELLEAAFEPPEPPTQE